MKKQLLMWLMIGWLPGMGHAASDQSADATLYDGAAGRNPEEAALRYISATQKQTNQNIKASKKAREAPLLVSFQGQPWALQVFAPGFTVMQNVTQANGRRYLSAEKGNFILSLT